MKEYFSFRNINFEVECLNNDEGKIIGARIRAKYKGREVEISTIDQGVYFFANSDRPKLRGAVRRCAYELIRSAR